MSNVRHFLGKPVPKATAPKLIYVVIDEDGQPQHAASFPEACHENISDAIGEHDLIEAKKWRVRKYVLAD